MKLTRLGLLVGSTALALAFAECALRLQRTGTLRGLSGEHSIRAPHPTRGWALEPDASAYQGNAEYGVHVRTNAQGHRDRERVVAKEPGVFRIVVLGDSFMEAYQVELEESLPPRLEAALDRGRLEVVNFGVGGYGTVQQYLQLREEGLRYRPDLVLLAFHGGNDLINNSKDLQALLVGPDDLKTFGRPYWRAAFEDDRPREAGGTPQWTPPDAARMKGHVAARARRGDPWRRLLRLLQPSMLAHVALQARFALASQLLERPLHDPNVWLGWPFLEDFAPRYASPGLDSERYAALWKEAWASTRGAILALRDLAREAGAQLVISTVPARHQVDAAERAAIEAAHPGIRLRPEKLHAELARFCARHEIPFIDLLPAFVASDSPLFFPLDRHWNASGHELAARVLAEELGARGLLPAPPGAASTPQARGSATR